MKIFEFNVPSLNSRFVISLNSGLIINQSFSLYKIELFDIINCLNNLQQRNQLINQLINQSINQYNTYLLELF